MMQDGAGPALLFLHGAGGAGALAALPGATRRKLRRVFPEPSRPRRLAGGGVDRAHLDLAFHYLDLLDALGLERVHLVGASFGGWIAAEIAIMASHRLASLVLIDPVGIKVDGWIYPFLFGMEHARDRGDDLSQSDGGAGPGAAGSVGRHALALQYRQSAAHRARGLESLSLRSAAAPPARPHRGAHAPAAGAPTTGSRRSRRAARRGAKEIPGARLRVFERLRATCRTSRSRTRWRRRSASSAGSGGRRGEVLLLPSHAVHHGPRRAVVVGDALQPPLRSGRRPHALQPVPRPARVRGAARLGRALRQRASPELLRHDAEPQRDGGDARAPHEPGEDRHPRQRPAAAREPAAHRRGDRDARRGLGRPRHLGLRARHQRGVLLDRRQPDALARALLRGRRADPARVDRRGPVPVRRPVLPLSLREPVAAAAPEAAPAGVVPVAGQRARRSSGRRSVASRT